MQFNCTTLPAQAAEALAATYRYNGRSLIYTLTPAGEPVLEEPVSGRCFSVAVLQQHPDGTILERVSQNAS